MADTFGLHNPLSVDLNTAEPRAVVCYIRASRTEHDGKLGSRIAAIFVTLIIATATTMFPVIASKAKTTGFRLYLYLFARYFGAGVIVSTGFMHLLQPAYEKIGTSSCVGMTGGWAGYPWPPAIALSSAFMVFVVHFAAERYAEGKNSSTLEISHGSHQHDQQRRDSASATVMQCVLQADSRTYETIHPANQCRPWTFIDDKVITLKDLGSVESSDLNSELNSIDATTGTATNKAFRKRIAAFLILESSVILHSVIVGLTLAAAGSEFGQLCIVVVFHQSFEGLGIGARLSAIPFPKRLKWWRWILCIAYGLSTPIAIAVGLGIRTSYDAGSFTADVVSGLLDSFSAGILIYTGFVELIARDFFFDPERTTNNKTLGFMVVAILLGAASMAVLAKWA